jgi:hypothetical protein
MEEEMVKRKYGGVVMMKTKYGGVVRSSGVKRSFLLGVILALFFCAPAMAELGYSDWVENGEPTMVAIFSGIYGGTWTNGGPHYTNGDITAYRVYDFDDGEETVNLIDGDQFDIDQIWTDGIATVTAQAKYAGLGQSFGWNQGEGVDGLATNYYELLTDADIGGDPEVIDITGDFLWGTQPNGDEFWSKMSLNADGGSDHLISFFIDGASVEDESVWLLFWEDLPSPGWDQDYQDFVVEIRAVPEPMTICLFGLGGLALLRKRRK